MAYLEVAVKYFLFALTI